MLNVAEYCILANTEVAKWIRIKHLSEAELHLWDKSLEEDPQLLLRACPAVAFHRAACILRLWDTELMSAGGVSSAANASFHARMPAAVAVIDCTLFEIYKVGLPPYAPAEVLPLLALKSAHVQPEYLCALLLLVSSCAYDMQGLNLAVFPQLARGVYNSTMQM